MNQAERDAINHPDSDDCCVEEDDNPLSYCLCNSPKLPLTAAKSRTFHLQASSGLCYSSHFYFLQKCHHFINLARHEIREAVHQSCLPTERTEPCMSPLHSSHHTHWQIHSPQSLQHAEKDLLCSKLSFKGFFLLLLCKCVSAGRRHILNITLSGVKTFACSKGSKGL